MAFDRDILRKRAREMRNNPTEPEKRLWRYLSNSQLAGHKFRRQAVIENSIVDFFCPQKRQIVEVDGDTHHTDSDIKRDKRLLACGYQTIRFSNKDVTNNMDGVLTALLGTLNNTADHWLKTDRDSHSEKERFE